MSIIASDIGSRQQDGPGPRLGLERVIDAETQARTDYIGAVISRHTRESNARLVARLRRYRCRRDHRCDARRPLRPFLSDDFMRRFPKLCKCMNAMFNGAVDRVFSRAGAAARAAARVAARAAVRFRDLTTVSRGIATLAARRSTAHGGRASQARGDGGGDGDAAASETTMNRNGGQLLMDKEPCTFGCAVLCV